jgi:hypothetical protein
MLWCKRRVMQPNGQTTVLNPHRLSIRWDGLQLERKVKNMQQNNITKVKASVIVDLLKLDENRNRGQTHGHGQSSIGGIAGCLTLKVRNGASHYIGGFKVANMTNTQTPRIVSVRSAVKGGNYAVHCFAHGTQRAVSSRKAMMHSVRCAGKTPTNVSTFAKGAIMQWCNGCVKQYISDNAD